MSKIKICGLYREEDIAYVNAAKPDYAGFIINFPKSHRNITVERARELREYLHKQIPLIGVFVDRPPEEIAAIAEADIIQMIQLHGCEDETYIRNLQTLTGKPVVKAFQVITSEEVRRAEDSCADFILLDSGTGSGRRFDWKLLAGIERPFFLAGGLSLDNIGEAISTLHPYALDISSGVETNRIKDREKIMAVVKAAHKEEI